MMYGRTYVLEKCTLQQVTFKNMRGCVGYVAWGYEKIRISESKDSSLLNHPLRSRWC